MDEFLPIIYKFYLCERAKFMVDDAIYVRGVVATLMVDVW